MNDLKNGLGKEQKMNAVLQSSRELWRNECARIREELEDTLIRAERIPPTVQQLETSTFSLSKSNKISIMFASKTKLREQSRAKIRMTKNSLTFRSSNYVLKDITKIRFFCLCALMFS